MWKKINAGKHSLKNRNAKHRKILQKSNVTFNRKSLCFIKQPSSIAQYGVVQLLPHIRTSQMVGELSELSCIQNPITELTWLQNMIAITSLFT